LLFSPNNFGALKKTIRSPCLPVNLSQLDIGGYLSDRKNVSEKKRRNMKHAFNAQSHWFRDNRTKPTKHARIVTLCINFVTFIFVAKSFPFYIKLEQNIDNGQAMFLLFKFSSQIT
jgi:hypothetical protein